MNLIGDFSQEVSFMSFLTTTYTLSNNVRIPKIGFGTWQVANGDEAYNSVKTALEAGYIHIDTAAAYENEESVGKAIKDSGINRDSLFITTKLANPCHGYEKTHEAFAQSLKALNLDYIDLYLIHWPNPLAFRDCWQEANAGTWKAFEELYSQDASLTTAEIEEKIKFVKMVLEDIYD